MIAIQQIGLLMRDACAAAIRAGDTKEERHDR
jgi:hypothetical protein